MKRQLVILAAPSRGYMHESNSYIEPYLVTFSDANELENYVNEKLTRKFSLKYKVALSDVQILFTAPLK